MINIFHIFIILILILLHKSVLSLVGAGPGDPELITIKAIKIIAAADVVLYDALVSKELLNYASPTCIKQFVGKKYDVIIYLKRK